MAEEIAFENGGISNFEGLVTLTLNPIILHTIIHHSSTSTCKPNFIEIEQTFCGRTKSHYACSFCPTVSVHAPFRSQLSQYVQSLAPAASLDVRTGRHLRPSLLDRLKRIDLKRRQMTENSCSVPAAAATHSPLASSPSFCDAVFFAVGEYFKAAASNTSPAS